MTTTFSPRINLFLSNYVHGVSNALVEAIINQFGGEEEFYLEAPIANEEGIVGITGFMHEEDFCSFFQANKGELIELVKEQSLNDGYMTSSRMLVGLASFGGSLDVDEVADGLYNDESVHHSAVARAVTILAAEKVTQEYACFLDEERSM